MQTRQNQHQRVGKMNWELIHKLATTAALILGSSYAYDKVKSSSPPAPVVASAIRVKDLVVNLSCPQQKVKELKFTIDKDR